MMIAYLRKNVDGGVPEAMNQLGDFYRFGRVDASGRKNPNKAANCVEINRWFGGSPPNFRTLYLGQIEVDSADFWTNRLLSSSSRSTAEELASKRSHTRTLKSG